jgi:hypothetical protein
VRFSIRLQEGNHNLLVAHWPEREIADSAPSIILEYRQQVDHGHATSSADSLARLGTGMS